ncbi:MAG: heparinase II/III family protein [Armatimonadetes bacterium]|nr:heparinase II/III family protein [Armatimonadota bacterium]
MGSGVPAGLVSLTVAASLLSAASASAEPRTLYKPGDIQNARENIQRHPWAREIVAGWKAGTALAMTKDRAFFDAMFSDLTPGSFYGQHCPVCVGKKSAMGEDYIWVWRIEAPEQVVCKYCGATFPDPKYPETETLVCPRTGQTFTYYKTDDERAHPEDETGKYAYQWAGRPVHTSWSGMIRYGKASWAVNQSLSLAKLYAITGDVRYAERAAWILDRFATLFPRYLYHSYDGTIADCPPAEAAANMGKHGGGGRFPKEVIINPYPINQRQDFAVLGNGFWGAGRFSVHGKGSDAGSLLAAAIAYDLIRDARYADGRPVLDAAMDRRITNDLLLAGCADMENWKDICNKSAPARALSAAVGVQFQRPESVRHGLEGFRLFMEQCFHFDGFCKESPAYSAHHLSNMHELPEILNGYSDPPGYQPAEGVRVENFDPFRESRYGLVLEGMARMLAPGRGMPIIADTFYNQTRISADYVEMLADRCDPHYAGLLETVQGAKLADKGDEYALWHRSPDLKADGPTELPLRTEWFPGWHVGVLRAGNPQGDTALYLNANERSGHRHEDTLSIIYYAFGQELASDRGYYSGSGELSPNGRNGQYWTRSTASHNLVLVDEKCQSKEQYGPAETRAGSRLELFGAAPGIEVVQAAGINVYPQCQEYRRTCALIRTPGGQTYAVDFFRVKGGENHKYCFHCNGSLAKMAPAKPAPEPVALPPAWDEWAYTGWVTNPRAVAATDPCTFTWRSGDVSLDLRLLNGRKTLDRILIVDAPGWRVSGVAEFDKPPVQEIMAEHRAGQPGEELVTQYAAVVVPYKGAQSPVVAARLLANDPETGVLAVEVKLADRTDTIISTKDQQQRRFGPVTASGEFAFLSVDARGRATQGYLLNGTFLECGDQKLALPRPNTPLKVKSVEGRTFHLAEALPGPVPAGAHVLAGDTGFEVASTTENSLAVRDYPVIPCEQVVVLNSRWWSRDR